MLDHDAGFLEGVEHLAAEEFIPYVTSVTAMDRIASETLRPCETKTST
ncbi:hypothetical protein Y590_04695 [Methylobacterium sp. AMS5]|nr:hypothetical protein Y590_04695 [Methylobacterium sp. AMS5]